MLPPTLKYLTLTLLRLYWIPQLAVNLVCALLGGWASVDFLVKSLNQNIKVAGSKTKPLHEKTV